MTLSGDYTTNNFLYLPGLGSSGSAEKSAFDAGLQNVDTRLGTEIWVGDPDYGTTLAAAITAVGATQAILRVPSGAWVGDDLTVPVTCTLRVERGATITVATGKTFTVNGDLQAGMAAARRMWITR